MSALCSIFNVLGYDLVFGGVSNPLPTCQRAYYLNCSNVKLKEKLRSLKTLQPQHFAMMKLNFLLQKKCLSLHEEGN